MVITSYCPPLVAISVVTFWRSTFSSRITHSRSMSGFLALKSSDSFCMRTMSPLLTVAMVSVVAASAWLASRVAAQLPMRNGMSLIDFLPEALIEHLPALRAITHIRTHAVKAESLLRCTRHVCQCR